MMVEDTPAQCNITDEENTLFYPWYTQYSWDNGFNPDYPRVASIWATAYQEKSGQVVDGVISITPTMVQDLLAATGESFTLSDGTAIDGTNATEGAATRPVLEIPFQRREYGRWQRHRRRAVLRSSWICI